MLTVTLSHYTLNGRRVHQVMVGGLPIIRETEDEAHARDIAERTFRDHHGRAVLMDWDGDTSKEREVERR
jgi:hypothetical protein